MSVEQCGDGVVVQLHKIATVKRRPLAMLLHLINCRFITFFRCAVIVGDCTKQVMTATASDQSQKC